MKIEIVGKNQLLSIKDIQPGEVFIINGFNDRYYIKIIDITIPAAWDDDSPSIINAISLSDGVPMDISHDRAEFSLVDCTLIVR